MSILHTRVGHKQFLIIFAEIIIVLNETILMQLY